MVNLSFEEISEMLSQCTDIRVIDPVFRVDDGILLEVGDDGHPISLLPVPCKPFKVVSTYGYCVMRHNGLGISFPWEAKADVRKTRRGLITKPKYEITPDATGTFETIGFVLVYEDGREMKGEIFIESIIEMITHLSWIPSVEPYLLNAEEIAHEFADDEERSELVFV